MEGKEETRRSSCGELSRRSRREERALDALALRRCFTDIDVIGAAVEIYKINPEMQTSDAVPVLFPIHHLQFHCRS